jgi:hypothetical protein
MMHLALEVPRIAYYACALVVVALELYFEKIWTFHAHIHQEQPQVSVKHMLSPLPTKYHQFLNFRNPFH